MACIHVIGHEMIILNYYHIIGLRREVPGEPKKNARHSTAMRMVPFFDAQSAGDDASWGLSRGPERHSRPRRASRRAISSATRPRPGILARGAATPPLGHPARREGDRPILGHSDNLLELTQASPRSARAACSRGRQFDSAQA